MRQPPWPSVVIEERTLEGDRLWRPPDEAELPEDMPAKLREAASAANIASHELTRILGQYEIFVALSDKDFLRQIKDKPSRPGIETIRMTLARSLIVGIAAFYDDDSRNLTNMSLKRFTTVAIDPKYFKCLEAFHIRDGSADEMDKAIKRLVLLRRQTKSGFFNKSMSIIKETRNSIIAHYDILEGSSVDLPFLRNLEYCFVVSALFVTISSRLLLARWHDVPRMRLAAQNQAYALRSSIIKGL